MRSSFNRALCSTVCLTLLGVAPVFAEDMTPPATPPVQGTKMEGMAGMAGMKMDHPMAAPVTDAVAVLKPFKDSGVSGTVRFTDLGDGTVKVVATLSGLAPNSVHAIHIHEFGDVSSDDGMSAGSHYNPEHHQHGKPGDANAHAGDFGNLTADDTGHATLELIAKGISLNGEHDPIVGRSVIVHEKPDDFGQPTGNAGGRSAGGVIGVAKAK